MTSSALPDPAIQSEFYSGVPAKRFFAWLFDLIFVAALTAILATLPFFVGWFFLPVIFFVANIAYRIATISARSATWGMRLFNIELRNHEGQRFDGGQAIAHTALYLVANAFFLPQIISLFLMILSERGQGLHDMLLGSAMINSPTRF